MIEVEVNQHSSLSNAIILEKRNFSKRSSLANDYKPKTRSAKHASSSNDHKSEKSLVRKPKKDTQLEELERMLLTDKR
jgi:hypothetical protein